MGGACPGHTTRTGSCLAPCSGHSLPQDHPAHTWSTSLTPLQAPLPPGTLVLRTTNRGNHPEQAARWATGVEA